MTAQNKYLVKIAGFTDFLAPAVRAIAKSFSTGAKAVGEQIHLATGGAQRAYAETHFPGMADNANALAKMTKNDFAQQLRHSVPIDRTVPRPMMAKAMKVNDIQKGLQTQTNSARLNTGLLAGGTLLAGNSLLNHIGNNSNDNASYYQ